MHGLQIAVIKPAPEIITINTYDPRFARTGRDRMRAIQFGLENGDLNSEHWNLQEQLASVGT